MAKTRTALKQKRAAGLITGTKLGERVRETTSVLVNTAYESMIDGASASDGVTVMHTTLR